MTSAHQYPTTTLFRQQYPLPRRFLRITAALARRRLVHDLECQIFPLARTGYLRESAIKVHVTFYARRARDQAALGPIMRAALDVFRDAGVNSDHIRVGSQCESGTTSPCIEIAMTITGPA